MSESSYQTLLGKMRREPASACSGRRLATARAVSSTVAATRIACQATTHTHKKKKRKKRKKRKKKKQAKGMERERERGKKVLSVEC